jgi:hypothetical protein
MRHFIPQMSPARHQQILDEVRAAARLGAHSIPSAALTAVPDPSDTFIGKLLIAFDQGKSQRNGTSET